MKNSIRIIAVALTIILLLCSCLNKEPPMEESTQTNTPLINNTVPLFNGEVIFSAERDSFSRQGGFPWQITHGITVENVGASEQLKEAMVEHDGEDVWYRVAVGYPNYMRYQNEYTPTSPEAETAINEANKERIRMLNLANTSNPGATKQEREEIKKASSEASKKYYDLKEADFQLYLSNIRESEFEFAKEIGASNIIPTASNSDTYGAENSYYMLLTAEMIEKMAERKTCSLALMPAPRTGEYSNKISDNLTYYLSQMTDTDTIQIVAVTVADNYNKYAYDSGIQVNINYNKDLYKPFSQGIGLSYDKFNNLLDEKIVEIMMRNNIAEKRVVNEKTQKASLLGDYYEKTPESQLESVSSGFNAVLTKAEILKLAEDEEIKVIYAAILKK